MRGSNHDDDDDDRDNMLQDDETGMKSSGDCDVQVKGNYETVGVSAEVKVGDCSAQQVLAISRSAMWRIFPHKVSKNKVPSLLAWAQEQGKVTGVVTTDRFEDVFFGATGSSGNDPGN